VPQQPLDRQLSRVAKRTPDAPALLGAGGALSYGALWEAVSSVAAAVAAAEPERAAVAVCEEDPAEALVLALGALAAEKAVALLGAHTAPQLLARWLAAAEIELVLGGGVGASELGPGVRVARREELAAEPAAAAEAPKRRRSATDRAVLLPAGEDLAVHSHFSLSAMGTSLTAFIPALRELTFVWTGELASWESLAGLTGALQYGGRVAMASADTVEIGLTAREGYTILSREQVDAWLAAGEAPAVFSALRYVFVSTGQFTRKWRERAETLLGRPLLPLWGAPEVGPVIAPHPSWFPVASHGLALVNVTLVPIDPERGVTSVVPWEMLDRAQLGVETAAAMSGYLDAAHTATVTLDKVLRTSTIVSIDHVGVVSVHA
jgi:hypothetical protein